MASNESLKFSDLAPFMGTEVHGLDINQPLSDEKFATLRRKFAERSILLIRNQDLSPVSHITFSQRFGELEAHVLQNFCLDGHPEIFVVSNIKEKTYMMKT